MDLSTIVSGTVSHFFLFFSWYCDQLLRFWRGWMVSDFSSSTAVAQSAGAGGLTIEGVPSSKHFAFYLFSHKVKINLQFPPSPTNYSKPLLYGSFWRARNPDGFISAESWLRKTATIECFDILLNDHYLCYGNCAHWNRQVFLLFYMNHEVKIFGLRFEEGRALSGNIGLMGKAVEAVVWELLWKRLIWL